MAGVKGRSGRRPCHERRERVAIYLPPRIIDRLEVLQMETGRSISSIASEALSLAVEGVRAEHLIAMHDEQEPSSSV